MSANASADLRTQGPPPGGRRLRRWWPVAVAVAVIALLAAGYALYARLAGGDDGWETVWSEGFDGSKGDQPDKSEWIYDTGTSYPGGAPQWGTGEIQTYVTDPANVALDGDGKLKITATRDPNGTWRSARLETKRKDFRADAGQTLKVEARIQVPDGGPGYWAAFWMLGEEFRGNYVNWPKVGEIDIMEFKGSEPEQVFGTFHCGVTPGGPCNENNGIGGNREAGTALPAGYHTYGVEWDRKKQAEEIRWYLDGRQFFTVKASDVDPTTWADATHHGFFVLLNLAVGGSFGGPPDASTRPGKSMLVDEVTVSRR
jgi:beta-glucanase (GH16 family)